MTTLELDDDVPVVEDIDLNIILDLIDHCDNTILNMLPYFHSRRLNADGNAHLHKLIKAVTLFSLLINKNYLIRMIDLSPGYMYHQEIYDFDENNIFIKNIMTEKKEDADIEDADIEKAEDLMEFHINNAFKHLQESLQRQPNLDYIIDIFAAIYKEFHKDDAMRLITKYARDIHFGVFFSPTKLVLETQAQAQAPNNEEEEEEEEEEDDDDDDDYKNVKMVDNDELPSFSQKNTEINLDLMDQLFKKIFEAIDMEEAGATAPRAAAPRAAAPRAAEEPSLSAPLSEAAAPLLSVPPSPVHVVPPSYEVPPSPVHVVPPSYEVPPSPVHVVPPSPSRGLAAESATEEPRGAGEQLRRVKSNLQPHLVRPKRPRPKNDVTNSLNSPKAPPLRRTKSEGGALKKRNKKKTFKKKKNNRRRNKTKRNVKKGKSKK
jgi:hypothetical protein